MNLIERWKNRETKKKLREENIRLREENKFLKSISKSNVCTVERNIQKVRGCVAVNERNLSVPEEYIKRQIAHNIVESILPFIEYDFQDNKRAGKIYTGTLHIATGDRKYET